MQNASALVTDRVVFYKHKDANFYSAAPFVLGRSLSQLPQVRIMTQERFLFSLTDPLYISPNSALAKPTDNHGDFHICYYHVLHDRACQP
jgi:hypothetical protein